MKKVLVLEDESSIRSFIVINLIRAGYEVVEAETGEEALEKPPRGPRARPRGGAARAPRRAAARRAERSPPRRFC